jgi:4-amino-4-deoxy-L-arabinose transferase-like glycosyltransferase
MATTIRPDPRLTLPADPIRWLLEHATASHGRVALVLVLVSLVAFLPGFFQIPPVDRDEARFAQASKQMIESGDFVDIRFQDEVRYKKPVGIYWLQAAVVKAAEELGLPQARTRIWLYRMPSLVGAVGAVLLTYWAALAFLVRSHAFLAALMMAGCFLLGVEARLAKTDAMLLLTILAVQGTLARAYLGRVEPGRRLGLALPAIFWTALAAGVLLKGPLILLFAGLTVLPLIIYERSARWLLVLRPVFGALWFLALVLPWFLAIMSRAGESFLTESVGRDLLAKVISPQESHGAPPGYYLALFWVTFWPAAPLAALAAPAVWTERWERPNRFLLAWLVPAWIALELVITKLPHYVLPLYPAIAILIARGLRRGTLSEALWLKRSALWWPVIAALVPLIGIGALMVLRHQLGLLAWPLAGAAMVFGFQAWRYYEDDGPEKSLVRAIAASVLIQIAFLGVIAPSLRPLFPSAMLARVMPADDCDYRIVAAAGYGEPSLVFLIGTSTRHTDGAGAADVLAEGPCRYALVEARQQRAFAQRAEAIGLRYALAGRVDGININGGRSLSIAIYRPGKQL